MKYINKSTHQCPALSQGPTYLPTYLGGAQGPSAVPTKVG